MMQFLGVIYMLSSSRTEADLPLYGRTYTTYSAVITANSAKYAKYFMPYTILLRILIYTHTPTFLHNQSQDD